MNDLAKFAGQCGKFPAALEQARKKATKDAAVGLANAIRAETRSAAPGGVLIGVSRKGAKVGVQALPAPSGDWLVKATGPFQLIERDTKAHTIPKRQLRAGFKARKPLQIPGIGFRRSVHHPGTHGKHPFEHGFDRYSPGVANVYERQLLAAMQRTFR